MRASNITFALLLSFMGCHLSHASYLQFSKNREAQSSFLGHSYLDSHIGGDVDHQTKLDNLWQGLVEAAGQGSESRQAWLEQHGREQTDVVLLKEHYPKLWNLHRAIEQHLEEPSEITIASWQAWLTSAFNSLLSKTSLDHEKKLEAALLLEILAKHSEVQHHQLLYVTPLGQLFSNQAIRSLRQLHQLLNKQKCYPLAEFYKEVNTIWTKRDPYAA